MVGGALLATDDRQGDPGAIKGGERRGARPPRRGTNPRATFTDYADGWSSAGR
jgi:hypothetical protein